MAISSIKGVITILRIAPNLDSNNGMSVSEEGILTLPTVSAHTSDVNTQIGTITVPVVTTNYQNFEFTIKVYI